MSAVRSLEFRIPISPTRSFFHQVRFFEHALRRLGGIYADAKLLVVVGDNTTHDAIVRENDWSLGRNVEWRCVPREIFDRYGIHGTADYRYVPETEADLLILSDADTVLARDLDPLVTSIDATRAVVAGHMAHYPPPHPDHGPLANVDPNELWPALLAAFEAASPQEWHRHSMDIERLRPLAPPYFNLGFVALTQPALAIFRDEIWGTHNRFLEIFPTFMRCQLAVTIVALRAGMRLETLSPQYNLANDIRHLICNQIAADDARVIHYLRNDELKREEMVLPENLPHVLSRRYENPVNQRLQQILRAYAAAEFDINA
ncbi:MAG: hypothetical protein WAU68_05920 [Vitreimonas sp.]